VTFLQEALSTRICYRCNLQPLPFIMQCYQLRSVYWQMTDDMCICEYILQVRLTLIL